MIKIDGKLRQHLVEFLSQLEILQTSEGIYDVFRNAGLGNLISRIKLAGSPRANVGNIIDFLADWGPENGQEALVLFMLAVCTEVGPERKKHIESIIDSFQSKVVVLPSIQFPSEPISKVPVEEKLIGEPTLLPIAFLETAIQLARSVVFIETSSNLGTGFLITKDLLLTCNHVLPSLEEAEKAVFRFNYQYNQGLGIGPTHDFSMKPKGFFATNHDLDYSVLELDHEPGREWGYIKVSSGAAAKIKLDERVNIIQHAGGRPKQISFRNNFVDYLDKNVIQYVTHTEPGSSGSPVFNDDWNLVAIHHAGGNLREPLSQRRYYRNEGILISAIFKCLPEFVLAEVSK